MNYIALFVCLIKISNSLWSQEIIDSIYDAKYNFAQMLIAKDTVKHVYYFPEGDVKGVAYYPIRQKIKNLNENYTMMNVSRQITYCDNRNLKSDLKAYRRSYKIFHCNGKVEQIADSTGRNLGPLGNSLIYDSLGVLTAKGRYVNQTDSRLGCDWDGWWEFSDENGVYLRELYDHQKLLRSDTIRRIK